jgi:hypothetical protein
VDEEMRSGLVGWGKGLITIGMLVSGVLVILRLGWSEGLLYYGLGTLGCGLVLVVVGAWAPHVPSRAPGRWDEDSIDWGTQMRAERERVAALQTGPVRPFSARDERESESDEACPWRGDSW